MTKYHHATTFLGLVCFSKLSARKVAKISSARCIDGSASRVSEPAAGLCMHSRPRPSWTCVFQTERTPVGCRAGCAQSPREAAGADRQFLAVKASCWRTLTRRACTLLRVSSLLTPPLQTISLHIIVLSHDLLRTVGWVRLVFRTC